MIPLKYIYTYICIYIYICICRIVSIYMFIIVYLSNYTSAPVHVSTIFLPWLDRAAVALPGNDRNLGPLVVIKIICCGACGACGAAGEDLGTWGPESEPNVFKPAKKKRKHQCMLKWKAPTNSTWKTKLAAPTTTWCDGAFPGRLLQKTTEDHVVLPHEGLHTSLQREARADLCTQRRRRTWNSASETHATSIFVPWRIFKRETEKEWCFTCFTTSIKLEQLEPTCFHEGHCLPMRSIVKIPPVALVAGKDLRFETKWTPDLHDSADSLLQGARNSPTSRRTCCLAGSHNI